MNLDTIIVVKRPRSAEEIGDWRPGHAYLAGGTWLFSEPQWETDTLVDLDGLGWPALEASADGLDIAATCRIAELDAFAAPPEWRAAPLIGDCCNAFLASFKIWNAATVGGNICMSLPAGPMISLAAALDGRLTLWPRGGPPREVAVIDFITGNHANMLAPGELLRAIRLPAHALARRYAMRQASLTRHGRSAALLVGTLDAAGVFALTVTAATPRPVQLRFERVPAADGLLAALDAAVAPGGWFDDVHGSASYKRRLARHFAEEIRAELVASGEGA
jgi:CO/xanthine dehydrogenase FAD-binding subunit